MSSPFRRQSHHTKALKRQIQSILVLIAFILAVLIYIYQYFVTSSSVDYDEYSSARRLSDTDDGYYINSLNEFPPLLFTHSQIKEWAWILYFCGMFYTFFGIAIICDDYFVPTVEIIAIKLKMSEDTAGATWLAIGTSAPELFTAFVGTFVAKSDVGYGTIIGSAVFNVLLIIGACAIFTSGNLKLQWWSFARDIIYFLLCLGVLALFSGVISKNEMFYWECIVLILLYLCYVLLMKYNERVKLWFFKTYILKDVKPLLVPKQSYGSADDLLKFQTQIDSDPDRDRDPNPKESFITDLPNLTDLPNITRKPKLTASSERSIEMSTTQISTPCGTVLTDYTEVTSSSKKSIRRGTVDNGSYISRKGKSLINTDRGTEIIFNELDHPKETGLDLSWPNTTLHRILYIIGAPLAFLMYYTCVDVTKPENTNYWPWTFIASLLWLGGLSYLMVWWAVCVGFAWNVPQVLMGLVFVAAGTSVPELFSCVIVAKKGKADMAVSGSIGSNIFDILIGLPLPWLLFALTQNDLAGDIKVDVRAHGLYLSILVLILMLLCCVLLIIINKWILTHCMGWTMVVLYIIFVAQDLVRYYWLDIEFR